MTEQSTQNYNSAINKTEMTYCHARLHYFIFWWFNNWQNFPSLDSECVSLYIHYKCSIGGSASGFTCVRVLPISVPRSVSD